MQHKIITLTIMILAIVVVGGCGKDNIKDTDYKPTNNKVLPEKQTLVDPKESASSTSSADKSANEEETDIITEVTTKPTPKPITPKPETKLEPEPESKPAPKPQPMQIYSPAFAYNALIPSEYTCDGTDINPQLNIANVPEGTKSLALIMDDPDAPGETWDHWILWNINPKTTLISKNSAPSGAKQGYNSWGNAKYGGPCPPSGTHRYMFKLYALDTMLSIASADGYDLGVAMKGHILKQVTLIGKYAKK